MLPMFVLSRKFPCQARGRLNEDKVVGIEQYGAGEGAMRLKDVDKARDETEGHVTRLRPLSMTAMDIERLHQTLRIENPSPARTASESVQKNTPFPY